MAIKSGTRFIDAMVADSSNDNRPRQVANAHYSIVEPLHFPDASLLLWNEKLADFLKIDSV